MTITVAERSAVGAGPTARPVHRPPLALRTLIGLVALGVGLFNVALMLSDRAPGITERIFGDFAVRLSSRLDRSERLGPLTEGRNPGNDAIVHIGVWAVAMVLVGLAVWRWAPLLIAAVLLFTASIVLEVGQGRYTTTRAVEVSDVIANGVGVAIGVAASIACYLVWSGLAAALGRVRGR